MYGMNGWNKDSVLISKQDTLDALARKAKEEVADINHYLEGFQAALDVVEQMPEVQPDRNGQERTGTDFISRQAAIDALGELLHEEQHFHTYEYDMIWNNAVDACCCTVDELPSAQPERMRGKWIFPYEDKRYKQCSVCGRVYANISANSKYCPNCGRAIDWSVSE